MSAHWDKYEDCPALYRKITVTVETPDGAREAMAYAMTTKDAPSPPAIDYYTRIARGYADWKLDAKTLQRARFSLLTPQR